MFAAAAAAGQRSSGSGAAAAAAAEAAAAVAVSPRRSALRPPPTPPPLRSLVGASASEEARTSASGNLLRYGNGSRSQTASTSETKTSAPCRSTRSLARETFALQRAWKPAEPQPMSSFDDFEDEYWSLREEEEEEEEKEEEGNEADSGTLKRCAPAPARSSSTLISSSSRQPTRKFPIPAPLAWAIQLRANSAWWALAQVTRSAPEASAAAASTRDWESS